MINLSVIILPVVGPPASLRKVDNYDNVQNMWTCKIIARMSFRKYWQDGGPSLSYALSGPPAG